VEAKEVEVEVVGCCLIHIHTEFPQPSFQQIEHTDSMEDSSVYVEGEGMQKKMQLVLDWFVIWIAWLVLSMAYLLKKVVVTGRKKNF
jgi:hypothetical protein